MTKIEIAYLAGIIDGEGCIRLAKCYSKNAGRLHIRITVANRSLKLVKWLKKKTGWKYNIHANSGAFYWRVTSEGARKILKLILPYLVIKKAQAKLALTLPVKTYKTNLKRNEYLYKKMSELKRESYFFKRGKYTKKDYSQKGVF